MRLPKNPTLSWAPPIGIPMALASAMGRALATGEEAASGAASASATGAAWVALKAARPKTVTNWKK